MLQEYNQLIANLKLASEHLKLANEMAARLGAQLFSEEETNKKRKAV